MKQEELQAPPKPEVKPETSQSAEIKSTFFSKDNLIDFLLGFALGLCFSIYSFYFLSILNSKKIKRVGMFWGCFVSFIIILFLCFSFAAYTSYKHETSKRNKALVKNHKRKLTLLSYSEFLLGKQTKVLKKHKKIHHKKQRKLRKMSKKHHRRATSHKRRKGKKVLIV